MCIRDRESTLNRVAYDDLLPPPSDDIVPLDFIKPDALPDFVKEKRIEFLLVQRQANHPDAPWDFPPAASSKKSLTTSEFHATTMT